MSLTVICLYMMIGLFLILCFYYKLQRFAKFAKQKYLHECYIERGIWLIPGPICMPLFGTKWIYFWQYKMSKIHQVYKDFYTKYGPIVLEVTTNGTPIVHLYDRQDIEKVLRYPSRYPFRPPTEIVAFYRAKRPDRYASVGITNEQGEKWHYLRTKLTPLITSPRILNGFMPALNEICNDFIDLLKVKRNEQNVVHDFQDVANLMGFEAVCTLMLGRRMDFLSKNPPNRIENLAAAVKQLFVAQRDSNYGFGLWKYWPTKTYRDFVKSEETIYNIISDIVDGEKPNSSTDGQDQHIRSVFDSILDDDGLDKREKKSAIIDFVSAGIETLANTLIFILFYTSRTPEHFERIRQEFDGDADHNITHDQLTNAHYTKACLQETFRVCPTAFCLARILEEDTKLSGYDLKRGTVILCQTMIACNNDKNFVNAQTFNPNRWLSHADNGDIINNIRPEDIGTNLVVPFGVGRRTCPGKRFVEMELTLLLAKLVREFDISFCNDMETECEFLLVPKVPVNLILRDRM